MKDTNELRALHDAAYVEALAKTDPSRLARILDAIALNPTDAVLDVGCGDAMILPLVADRIGSYVGVDFSPPFIEAAQRRAAGIDKATFACDEITAFCTRNPARFDVAFAMDIAEHVYDHDWLPILASVRSSLRPGGKLYLHTPNREFFVEAMKHHRVLMRQLPEHIAVRTPAQNRALLESAGYRIESLQLIPHYNVLRHLHALSHLPLVGRFLKARIFIAAVA